MVAWIAVYTKTMQKPEILLRKTLSCLHSTLITSGHCPQNVSVDTVSPMLAVEVWCPPQLITRGVIWCKLSAKLCHLVVKPYCIQAFKGPKLAFRSSWADDATQKKPQKIFSKLHIQPSDTCWCSTSYFRIHFLKNDCLFSVLQGWLT